MRRVLIWGGVAVALLAAADGLAWHWATGVVRTNLEAWAQARRSEGWTVRMSDPEPTGWPLSARVIVHDLALSLPFGGLRDGVGFTAQQATLGVSLLAIRHLEIRLDGDQTLRVGTLRPIPYKAAVATVALDLPADALPSFADISLEGLVVTSSPDAPVTVRAASARVVAAPGVLRATLEAQDIGLPPSPIAAGMGRTITRVAADGALNGDLTGSVPAWRDGGGSLVLRRFALNWGPLLAEGTATLRLDAGLQPEGQADATLTGMLETLDALSNAKVLAARGTTAAKAVLGLLQRPQPNGPPSIQLPLMLQDRTVSMGRIPLAKLPEVIW